MKKYILFILAAFVAACEPTELDRGDARLTTGDAVEITSSSADLCGRIVTSQYCTVWFELSKNREMNDSWNTSSKTLNSEEHLSQVSLRAEKLSPNTTFYYRICGKYNYGNYSIFAGKGEIRSFTTDYVSVTGVSLNTTSVSLEVGGTATLTATVSPSDVTDKSVTWKSSNTTVATVDSYGKVTAKSAGTATITVTTTDGNKTATCIVTVVSSYEMVDLGLSVKWATCNVGATKPEEYGYYFAWGETTTKSTYNWSTYKYCNGSSTTMTKYCTSSSYGTVDNRTKLELSDDAARANWGGRWRMPTATEIDELFNNCTWTWTTHNGVYGYKVIGKKSGYTDKSIFLPAAGFRNNDNLDYAGSYGYYWSSSLNTSYSYGAYVLYFYSGDHYRNNGNRCNGRSVRPVCPSDNYVSVTGVELNTTSVSLVVGGTTTLTATISPSNATDKSVQWSSSNTSVATVDSIGNVTAKSAGTATITVTTTDGNKTATCTVTVKLPRSDGSENGHDYVDLGLPSGLKWATCNVGASKPEDYGDYFAWGETTTKSTYNWSTYKYCNGSSTTMTKYCTSSSYGTVDNRKTLELSDDAARANWGGRWRMPTEAEFGELTSNCTWEWTTQNGVNGYNVTSKKAGYTDKFIFLPAAGCRLNGDLSGAGSHGNYWASSIGTTSSGYNAYELSFNSGSHGRGGTYRYYGQSVRPVCPSDNYVSVTGVKLNTTSVSLEVGGTTTLTATVSPSDATDKSVTWKSSNTSVATVDSNGKITAKSAGTVTITVTTTDGNFTATCTVTVKSPQVSVTGVKLNTSSVSLEVGGTTTLTATISPSNATDKSVTWKSSNTTVATVDSYGKVTAKSAGTATITVTTTDGSNTATCTVTVKSQQSSDGKENGHDYVDLGLPSGVKWATCNIGASKPEEYGSYFAWGETTTKSTYNWSTYKYCNGSSTTMTKYCTYSSYGTVDNKTTLELSDDAAHANWGGSWRMPTASEINELWNNCTWTWTTQNGVNGYKVTSKKAGYTDKFIFLPAAGYRDSLYSAGSYGYYWSSSLVELGDYGAYVLYFYSDDRIRGGFSRYFGQSVRPVCP